MKSTSLVLLTCSLLTGCADMPTTGGGASSPYATRVEHVSYWTDVAIVPPLTATEIGQFQNVGSLSCKADVTFSTIDPQTADEICSNLLKDAGYKKRADVVVINTKNPIPCRNPGIDKGPCVEMTATGYRRRD